MKLPEIPRSLAMDSEISIPLSNKLTNRDPEVAAEQLLKSLQVFSEMMCYLVVTFVQVIKSSPKQINLHLQNSYTSLMKARLDLSCTTTHLSVKHAEFTTKKINSKTSKSNAKNQRQLLTNPSRFMRVVQKDLFPLPQWHPILRIETVSCSDNTHEETWDPQWISYLATSTSNKSNLHLVVLVHGFQGNSYDMRLIKAQLALVRPDLILLSSHMNEGETDGDIMKLGRNLALEIEDYLANWRIQTAIRKLSFIGHSLGGIIIRAALPHLLNYCDKMHVFISFSSPHLGCMYNESKLVDAGMWVLKKRKGNLCLRQLGMDDKQDPRETCMYRLSEALGMEWFKIVALVGSYQDLYVPYESARIELPRKAALGNSSGEMYSEMARNILERLTVPKLYRIDVDFKVKGQKFDSFIGRAAHIQMLDNSTLFMMIFYSCARFFE